MYLKNEIDIKLILKKMSGFLMENIEPINLKIK